MGLTQHELLLDKICRLSGKAARKLINWAERDSTDISHFVLQSHV